MACIRPVDPQYELSDSSFGFEGGVFAQAGQGRNRAEDTARGADAGGAVRPIHVFVDLGPPMAYLVRRLQKRCVAVDYIEKLLAAFSEDDPVVAPKPADPPSPLSMCLSAHRLLPVPWLNP